jgi:hypothetical protein
MLEVVCFFIQGAFQTLPVCDYYNTRDNNKSIETLFQNILPSPHTHCNHHEGQRISPIIEADN